MENIQLILAKNSDDMTILKLFILLCTSQINVISVRKQGYFNSVAILKNCRIKLNKRARNRHVVGFESMYHIILKFVGCLIWSWTCFCCSIGHNLSSRWSRISCGYSRWSDNLLGRPLSHPDAHHWRKAWPWLHTERGGQNISQKGIRRKVSCLLIIVNIICMAFDGPGYLVVRAFLSIRHSGYCA